ncbi:hypothetical protein B7494_g6725 [Chlorociboria aeruginascens]|nr:hypothetical protein B7494_g6725 [Chlorociboria aeruginascens]
MQIATIALLVCLAATGQAVSIQRDASPNSARGLPNNEATCLSQTISNHTDMDAAAAKLTSWCDTPGNKIASGKYVSFTGPANEAMAYVCADSDSNGETCNSGDWGSAVADWNNKCGEYTAAVLPIKTWRMQYGQGNIDPESICDGLVSQNS